MQTLGMHTLMYNITYVHGCACFSHYASVHMHHSNSFVCQCVSASVCQILHILMSGELEVLEVGSMLKVILQWDFVGKILMCGLVLEIWYGKLTLKALGGDTRSSKATLVYHELYNRVETMSIFEKQLIKLPARAESFRKPTSLHLCYWMNFVLYM